MKLSLAFGWLSAIITMTAVDAARNRISALNTEDEGPSIGAAESLGDSPPLTMLPYADPIANNSKRVDEEEEERGFYAKDTGNAPDGALQRDYSRGITSFDALKSFEGISIQDVQNAVGFAPIPPDPAIDVGRTQVVEMVNSAYQVYDKETGKGLLTAPMALANIWSGTDRCSTSDGDPIPLYDQVHDRWVLMQFAVRHAPYYLCFAVSETEDATGSYHLFRHSTGNTFPDYPKMGIWDDKLVVTTVDFAFGYTGVSVFAFNLNKMMNGETPDVVEFTRTYRVHEETIGWGLLPADVDGDIMPDSDAPIPLIGSQDDDADFGAKSDGVNIWELRIDWNEPDQATLEHAVTLDVVPFDSIMDCSPTSLDCVPQKGTDQKLDQDPALQRFLHRFAYRKFVSPAQEPGPEPQPAPQPAPSPAPPEQGWYLGFFLDLILGVRNDPAPDFDNGNDNEMDYSCGTYESMVTNVAVEARRGIAGPRWYELLRDCNGNYAIHQQGTYSPDDGISRFYGSMAQDKKGNMAIGFSAVGEDTYPGIRAAGRSFDGPLGEMNLGESIIVEGGGAQTGGNRWGDYTSINMDPVDDCTFWYVAQYMDEYSDRGWKTKIAAFNLGGCDAPDEEEADFSIAQRWRNND